MAYIGRGLDKISNIEKLDVITFDGSSSYTLQKNSVNFTPNSANSLQVSIDGVVQAGNFTVSGSTIDFGVAIPSTSTNDFIFHYGTGLVTTVADGAITTAKLGDAAVTTAKLGDAAVTTAKLDDASVTSAKLSGVTQGITQADQWRQTANLTGNAEPITANLERNDTAGYGSIGSAMTVSSGIFTFPSTGIWRVEAVFAFYAAVSTTGNMYGYIQSTQNNSSYIDQVEIHMFAASNDNGVSVPGYFMFDVTDTSTHKVRFTQKNFGNTGDLSFGNTDRNMTYFTFTRLGDT